MIDILQFVFSSFWVWLGTVILIATMGWSLALALVGILAAVNSK